MRPAVRCFAFAVAEFTQLIADEAECRTTYADGVPLGYYGARYGLAIDECSIVAIQVDDLVLSVTGILHYGVVTGGGEVVHDQVVIGCPPDPEPAHRLVKRDRATIRVRHGVAGHGNDGGAGRGNAGGA